jgi:hypothetical protein
VYEVVALLAGCGLGYGLRHVTAGRAVLVAAVVAVAIGLTVSTLSGELEIGFEFLVFDTGQVLVAALAVRALARAYESRQTHVT